MSTKIVNVPDVGQVKLYKRKGSRAIRLSLDRSGGVRVTLPYWLPYTAGLSFVAAKRDWIAAQAAKIKPSELSDGRLIGKSHRLRFVAKAGAARPSVRLRDDVIEVTYPAGRQTTDDDIQKAALRGTLKALTIESEQVLPDRLAELAKLHGYHYRGVSFKRLSSRWGSCDNHRNIILNIYLMTLPWELIDYVLMHELNHTVVLQHGPKFWTELEKALPEARQLSKRLRGHATHF